ncbi:MAG TPA: hypothetical protein VJC10_00085 [Patescibacteria group bacterium]|nr:hypothetical protein [Patescibacteria group bacterium]
MQPNTNTLLQVTIRNREAVLKDDTYASLSSTNEVGTFDILPMHENFITLIKEFITLRKTDGTKEDLKISTGVMKVVDNAVVIYLDIIPQAPQTISNKQTTPLLPTTA